MERLVRVQNGHIVDLGDVADTVGIMRTSGRPPVGASACWYGFACVCAWRDVRGREKTYLLSVMR